MFQKVLQLIIWKKKKKKKKKKKTGLKLAVKTTSVDFNLIDTNNIFDIRKYLMKRTWHKKMFVLIKKHFLDIY